MSILLKMKNRILKLHLLDGKPHQKVAWVFPIHQGWETSVFWIIYFKGT